MSGLHAPLTRRLRHVPSATASDEPLSDLILDALRRGERALTRRAQDEADIETLLRMREAIRRAGP